MTKTKLAIACQGGGSQTAFTAGVLSAWFDQNIQDKYDIVGLSGTSGGGICALLAWYGLIRSKSGSGEPPSKRLLDFWFDNTPHDLWESLLNSSFVTGRRLMQETGIAPAPGRPQNWAAEVARSLVAHSTREEFYDLRKLLKNHVDFDDLQGLTDFSPRLFLGAIDVLSGGFRSFDSAREDITADMVLASAAVPSLFDAVEVEGKFYWDGLFAENPPLGRMLQTVPDEIWVIQINPKTRDDVPDETAEIADRRNELSANVMLAIELRVVEMLNDLLESDAFQTDFLAKGLVTKTKIRIVDMSDKMARSLDHVSKLDRSAQHIRALVEDGRTEGALFLEDPDDPRYHPPGWWSEERPLFTDTAM